MFFIDSNNGVIAIIFMSLSNWIVFALRICNPNPYKIHTLHSSRILDIITLIYDGKIGLVKATLKYPPQMLVEQH